MTTSTIALSESFFASVPRELFTAVGSTIEKLRVAPESPGLHVEKINDAADDRIRSIRVTQQYRMLAFRLTSPGADPDLWMLQGVYDHDDAYRAARTLYLRVNPTSGQSEIRDDGDPGSGGMSEQEIEARINARAAEIAAEKIHEYQEQQRTAPALQHSVVDLQGLGFDRDIAAKAVKADEDQLLALAMTAGGWQEKALVDLATGATFEQIRADYFTPQAKEKKASPDDVIASVRSEASRSSFHLIEDDEALARVLASGNFDRWRVFLHPEQEKHVHVRTRGPFRLTGGAGTGKTVVLVHRAVELARRHEPAPRIVLTTFTRNLGDALDTQVRMLDPQVPRAAHLGEAGIHVDGIDTIARTTVLGSNHAADATAEILGWRPRGRFSLNRPARDWDDAIAATGGERDDVTASAAFLQSEYANVILPARILEEGAYLRAPRTGRGTRLGRAQRRAVWQAVAAYRENGARQNVLDWDELSAIAAAALDRAASAGETRPADHVLIDEGQDLRPTHWQMLRALVEPGDDDMFIAEDSHQRIYGVPVKLGAYGIRLTGRSRRLKLNYRTTAQNLDFAMRVLKGGDYDLDAMDDELTENEAIDLGVYRSARSGVRPRFLGSERTGEELTVVADVVREWIEQIDREREQNPAAAGAEQIGLLTRTRHARDLLVRALDERGIRAASVDRGAAPDDKALVMTLHRAKGMEFSKVVLFGVDDGAVPSPQAERAYDEAAVQEAVLRERSLLYVGASRARDELVVTWSKQPSEYIKETVQGAE